jgi:general secretion pathway protein G
MCSAGPVSSDDARRDKRRSRWECILVVVCVAVVSGLALLQVMARTVFVSHCDKAPRDIASICAAIDSFMRAHDGQAPESLELLVTPDAHGYTYLNDRTVIPTDPWSNPYGYEPRTEEPGYRVFSLGKDGRPGGSGYDADVDNFTIAGER